MIRRIGLLGGSFNPAHSGHLYISRTALRRLKLDAVWWLVSPQNPLKASDDMADYETRVASALAMTRNDRRILVSQFEAINGLRYTSDTVDALVRLHPRTRFVWLMGADNLAQIDRWHRWTNIVDRLPLAIFDRAPFAHRALRSKAALRLHHRRVTRAITGLADLRAPAWAYLTIRRHPASSTAIRKKLGNFAVWRHNK